MSISVRVIVYGHDSKACFTVMCVRMKRERELVRINETRE